MPDRLDRFESAFRHAEARLYEPLPVEIARVAYVTDLEGEEATASMAAARGWLRPVDLWEETTWGLLPGGEWDTVETVLGGLERMRPDLVIAHRWLRETAFRPHHSLGVVLDVLTQAQKVPVLVLPEGGEAPRSLRDVLVLTDHLAECGRLVDWGSRMTATDGRLTMVHIEDGVVFDRYARAISRSADLASEETPQAILAQLLHEPERFIASAREVLAASRPGLEVESVVKVGHGVSELLALVEARHADLLVMDTKSEGQLAMHGTAYALAIELSDTPLLLL